MTPEAELAALRRAAAEVLALHRPSEPFAALPGQVRFCETCRRAWPCPTVQALPAVLVYQENP